MPALIDNYFDGYRSEKNAIANKLHNMAINMNDRLFDDNNRVLDTDLTINSTITTYYACDIFRQIQNHIADHKLGDVDNFLPFYGFVIYVARRDDSKILRCNCGHQIYVPSAFFNCGNLFYGMTFYEFLERINWAFITVDKTIKEENTQCRKIFETPISQIEL